MDLIDHIITTIVIIMEIDHLTEKMGKIIGHIIIVIMEIDLSIKEMETDLLIIIEDKKETKEIMEEDHLMKEV